MTFSDYIADHIEDHFLYPCVEGCRVTGVRNAGQPNRLALELRCVKPLADAAIAEGSDDNITICAIKWL